MRKFRLCSGFSGVFPKKLNTFAIFARFLTKSSQEAEHHRKFCTSGIRMHDACDVTQNGYPIPKQKRHLQDMYRIKAYWKNGLLVVL